MSDAHPRRAGFVLLLLSTLILLTVVVALASCGGSDKYVGKWKVTTDNGKPEASSVSWIITIEKLGDKYRVSEKVGYPASSALGSQPKTYTYTYDFTKEGETLGYSNAAGAVMTISVNGDTLTLTSSSTNSEVKAVRQ
jgi:hypothetical protein